MGEKHFTQAIKTLTDEGLPVAKIVPDILKSVAEKKITIVTAKTGSGKTLLANAALADSCDHPVWVLVPRRFLAINAAESVAKLSGKALGQEVGYAIGQKSTGRSNFSPTKSKLIFATYGYALSSGLLDDPKTKTIVCDEVHEAGIDTSLARAIIHKRLQERNDLNVVEMSATINAQKHADYWHDVAKTAIHKAEGNPFKCDYRHIYPHKISFEEAARDLLIEVDKTEYKNVKPDNQEKGIAVFVEGVKVAEDTAAHLRQLFKDAKMFNVEVATIYADMDDIQRKAALAAPKKGNLKVLVGTNVIESGMNLPWLRAGISNGRTKVPHYHYDNGSSLLNKEELPQWRITQQMGRVYRFDNGKFILHSEVKKEDRPEEHTPDIARVSLNGLIMYAANYNIDPTNLKFDADVDPRKLHEAKQDLIRLQLLDEDCKLTKQGKFVMGLPLGPEAGAMLWAAKEKFPDIMNHAIDMVAVVEVAANKGMRADMNTSHKKDFTSDVLDTLKAFRHADGSIHSAMTKLCKSCAVELDGFRSLRQLRRDPTEAECAANNMLLDTYTKLAEQERLIIEKYCAEVNMSVVGYKDAKELIVDLHHRLSKDIPEKNVPAKDQQLIKILLHGSVNHIFAKHTDNKAQKTKYDDLLRENQDFKQDKYTAVNAEKSDERFAIAHVREINTDDGPVTIAHNITRVSTEALMEFLANRPDILTDKKIVTKKDKNYLQGRYFGGAPIEFRISGKPFSHMAVLTEGVSSGGKHKDHKPKGKHTGYLLQRELADTPQINSTREQDDEATDSMLDEYIRPLKRNRGR